MLQFGISCNTNYTMYDSVHIVTQKTMSFRIMPQLRSNSTPQMFLKRTLVIHIGRSSYALTLEKDGPEIHL